ncbi:MAG: tail fiber protein, partial [Bacteroidia bacterium]
MPNASAGTAGQLLASAGAGVAPTWINASTLPAPSSAWNILGNAGTVAGTNFIGTTDNVDFVTRTNNTEKIRVTSAGDVGIGTATPTAGIKLHVYDGNAKIGKTPIVSGTNITHDALLASNSGYNLIRLAYNNSYDGGYWGNLYFGPSGPTTATVNSGFNVAVGSRNLIALTTGSNNLAFGWGCLADNTTGGGNVAIGGQSALTKNTSGFRNVALGVSALYNNTVGNDNVAIGSQAAINIVNISNPNIAIGAQSLTGGDPLPANNTASNNVVVGYQAMYGTTGTPSTGLQNVAVGNQALSKNTSGTSNVSIGYQSLQNNTSGNGNTATGRTALANNTTGAQNTATGAQVLMNNTTGTGNTASGHNSLNANTTAGNNTATGNQSMSFNTIGQSNTASGASSLLNNITGSYNTASGASSLQNNSTGSYNTATGYQSFFWNTTGSNNTAYGVSSLLNNTTASDNVAIGAYSLRGNTTGVANTIVGSNAAYSTTTGDNNTTQGYFSLYFNTTGAANTVIGSSAGLTNTTGSNNTLLGYNTDVAVNNLTNATAIGYKAKVGASNSLVLGGTGADAVNVGIGTTTPNAKALLDMVSTSKGLLMPRVTSVQRLAINNNTADATIAGLQVYDLTTSTFWYHDGTYWVQASNNPDPSLGAISIFPYTSIPTDYLECNGSAVSRSTYSAFFAKIGTTYGAGNGSTTFNLPDLRGEFVRGYDNGRGADAARVMGSNQLDDFKSHDHLSNVDALDLSQANSVNGATQGRMAPYARTPTNVGLTGGAETRPRNVAMVYAIKAIPTTVTIGSTTIQNIVTTTMATNAPASAQATDATALTTSSTTWVDMVGMAVTVTTTGGNMLINFNTASTSNAAPNIVGFRFTIDGTAVTAALYGNAQTQQPGPSFYQQNVAATWLATSVSAGTHTVKVQWRVSAGSAVAPESGEETNRTLNVVEIK